MAFLCIPANKILTLQNRQGVLYSRQAEKRKRRICIAYDMMGRKERKIIMMKEEFLKNMKEQDVIFERIAHLNPRSAWNRGVMRYALELVNSIDVGEEITEKKMLNGAENWHQYSEGGCALIDDELICRRLCTPSEIKKTHNGERRPNSHETWMDVQARALYQAARLIMKIKREVEA